MDPAQAASSKIAGDLPELFFCRDMRGYGWVFRKDNYLNVGLGRTDSHEISRHVKDFVGYLTQDPRGRSSRQRHLRPCLRIVRPLAAKHSRRWRSVDRRCRGTGVSGEWRRHPPRHRIGPDRRPRDSLRRWRLQREELDALSRTAELAPAARAQPPRHAIADFCRTPSRNLPAGNCCAVIPSAAMWSSTAGFCASPSSAWRSSRVRCSTNSPPANSRCTSHLQQFQRC